jgi:beta-glucosidase
MKNSFPIDFRFGVADADLQVIGEKFARAAEGSEESMWSWFARESGKVHNDTPPDVGANRYGLWESDIALMRELGVRNYRTSVSMSRLLTPKGEINVKAAQWYERYFTALRKNGIAVYATLYHWELPQFLNAQGGWKNRLMVDWLCKHAEAVYQTLGEYIEEYFILNEPWCSSFLSYHLGVHAPGETDLSSGLLAAHNLLLAQGAAFEKLKSLDRSLKVSTVLNLAPTYAATPSVEDGLAARYADVYHNTWFLEPIFNGRYPELGLELFRSKLPYYGKADLALMQIGPRMHSLGVNYYRGELVAADERAELKFKGVRRAGEEVNDLGWPIYVPPLYREGLYDILQQIWFAYRGSGLKNICITENGMAQASDTGAPVIPDARRLEYLKAHIKQCAAAIERGVPLTAYFLWTLMDNYEWAEGHRPESCFGIIGVDRKTMKRTKKSSAVWYGELLKSGIGSKPPPVPEIVKPVHPPTTARTAKRSQPKETTRKGRRGKRR